MIRSPRSSRRSRGMSSTNPTRLIPYSGCCRYLRATSWPTSPAPTMIVFCTYSGRRRQIARAATTGKRDQHDRERPERSRLLEVRLEEARHVTEAVDDPDRHGDEVEDADDVVDGRVVGALLVAVVERVDLRGHHPGRQRDQEEQPLRARGETLEERRAGGEQRLGEEERRDQADHVGDEERAPDEPAATVNDGSGRVVTGQPGGRSGCSTGSTGVAVRICQRQAVPAFPLLPLPLARHDPTTAAGETTSADAIPSSRDSNQAGTRVTRRTPRLDQLSGKRGKNRRCYRWRSSRGPGRRRA